MRNGEVLKAFRQSALVGLCEPRIPRRADGSQVLKAFRQSALVGQERVGMMDKIIVKVLKAFRQSALVGQEYSELEQH